MQVAPIAIAVLIGERLFIPPVLLFSHCPDAGQQKDCCFGLRGCSVGTMPITALAFAKASADLIKIAGPSTEPPHPGPSPPEAEREAI
jgi:hypothetical protein